MNGQPSGIPSLGTNSEYPPSCVATAKGSQREAEKQSNEVRRSVLSTLYSKSAGGEVLSTHALITAIHFCDRVRVRIVSAATA